MQVEITAAGFDGGTDQTDDRVFWIEAQIEAQVQDAIAGTGAHYCPLPGNEDGVSVYAPAIAIDYRLPAEHDALRGKLLELQANPPVPPDALVTFDAAGAVVYRPIPEDAATATQLLTVLQDLDACNWLDEDPSDSDELAQAKANAKALLFWTRRRKL